MATVQQTYPWDNNPSIGAQYDPSTLYQGSDGRWYAQGVDGGVISVADSPGGGQMLGLTGGSNTAATKQFVEGNRARLDQDYNSGTLASYGPLIVGSLATAGIAGAFGAGGFGGGGLIGSTGSDMAATLAAEDATAGTSFGSFAGGASEGAGLAADQVAAETFAADTAASDAAGAGLGVGAETGPGAQAAIDAANAASAGGVAAEAAQAQTALGAADTITGSKVGDFALKEVAKGVIKSALTPDTPTPTDAQPISFGTFSAINMPSTYQNLGPDYRGAMTRP